MIGIEGTTQRFLVDGSLGTGVSTRQPIAWIDLGVDEGERKKWTLSEGPSPGRRGEGMT